ncbi:presequence protease, mitochondrial [Biomphalaria glabrata]|nr:presequence protease, mitochondrial [Biomphalaria glabrata]
MHILKRAGFAFAHLAKACNTSTSGLRCLRHLNEDARNRIRALKIGDKLHGYTVQRIDEVPDYYITAILLSHDKTGAQHLHAARDDDNNTFGVTFRTTPLDNTGVSHILEHTVLCGSEKYPVRDPFFKMLSRSMATFMNALTAYDWTMYPISSQNQQDFKNLMSIYLDAVFCPLLRELDFCQEGWRLEHTDLTNVSSPIVFKGVVYNEMKGVFSNSQNIYSQQALNSLLPSHTYGVVSGGDPAEIVNLTHEQLKKFHASHYHPSNAKFFTYGNFPLEEHLSLINQSLDKFDKINPSQLVPNEPRWKEPKTKTIYCPPDPLAADPEKQTTVSVSYLLSDITDVHESFIASVLGYLLTNGETSPFYRALLEPNIGSDFSPNTGCHEDTKEAVFSVGLANISPESVNEVLDIIEDTIDKIVREGFDKKKLDALLHRLELGMKHESSNFGLHLAMGLANVWNHEGDPVTALQVGQIVQNFKESLKKNPKLLQQKVKEYLKDNKHKLTLIMQPDESYIEKNDQAEKERLNKFVSPLTDSDKENLLKRGQELELKQNAKEDISCLPSLKISDLSKTIKPEEIDIKEAGGSFIQVSVQPTNGVTYLRMASNLDGLPEDLMPYIPLFCQVITGIGADWHDYLWMSHQEELYTGGLLATPLVVPHHTDVGRMQRSVLLSSYCLEKNFDKMLDLWTLALNSPDFSDVNRISTLIRMAASDMAASLSDSGHQFAITNSAASLDKVSNVQETFFGISQVKTMKSVAEMSDLSDIIFKFQCIGDIVLDKTSFRISLNVTPKAIDRSIRGLRNFLGNLKGQADMSNIFPDIDQIEPASSKTHHELPFNVNYVAQSYPGVLYTHKDYTPLCVLSNLMTRKFLHREIREKGGAYGSGAQLDSGIFSFYSYRDPKSLETLEVFKNCVEWASKGEFTEQDVEEAKLGIFQKTDKPVPPSSRGKTQFIYDISDEMRQKNRDRLFRIKTEDLIRVSNTYLKAKKTLTGITFLGPSNPAIQGNKDWKVVKQHDVVPPAQE